MVATTLVSVEEYLDSGYRPDVDFINGELLERNVGEPSHGTVQLNVASWLKGRSGLWRTKVVVEVRVRINERRYRIPDVMVLSLDAPREEIVEAAPLLCIEILSRRDSLNQIWDRTQDYLAMGVPVCWIIDPLVLRAWTVTSAGLVEVKDGILRAGKIEMPLAEVSE